MARRPASGAALFQRAGSSARPLSLALSCWLALPGGQAVAAADDVRGAQLAAACASCHSPDGRDVGMPTIVGMDAQAMIDAMLAYRASETPSHVMHAVALSLTEAEIISVARYLAAQAKAGAP